MDLDTNAIGLAELGEERDPTHDRGEPGVAILLSTFNGRKFLGDQLRSFTAQTHGNWQLYWRDDGSTDGSQALLSTFTTGPGRGRCVHAPDDGKLRTTGSFLALLRLALTGDASYFAFADQDDFWLPEKLSRAVAAIDQTAAGRPALYFCARTLVDSALRPYGHVPAPRRQPGFPAALTQNVIPGCCMMLNRAAAELIDAAEVPETTWHDWWCYLVVSAVEGLVIAGDVEDILYRQHPGNLVGEPRGVWRRIAGAVRRGRQPFMTIFWRHVAALRAHPIPLPDKTSELLAVIERTRDAGMLARLKALCIPGLVRQTWLETMLFRLWFLLG